MRFVPGTIRVTSLVIAGVLLVMAAGCRARSDSPAVARNRQRLGAFELEKAPPIQHVKEVRFGDAPSVHLLGYELRSGAVEPGGKLEMTFFWRANGDLRRGWELTTRVLDPDQHDEEVADADGAGPLRKRKAGRQALPPGEWLPGRVYVDRQTVDLPRNLKAKRLAVYAGLRFGQTRMYPRDVESMIDGRAKIFEVKVRSEASPVPEVAVPRLPATSSIRLDGRLNEPEWSTAAVVLPLPPKGTDAADFHPWAEGRMLWSGQALYVGVTVQDDDVDGWRRDLAKDAPVFRRDGLELLLKPNREARECFRIAVSPNGQLYDSRFDRIEGPNAVLGGWLEHVEWERVYHPV